jgi:hypothetical protein
MRGDNWPSLVATSIAEAAEMGEMVAESLEEYEEKAVLLALQPVLMCQWKLKLAEKRKTAPLFDSDNWIRCFELKLEEVWRRHAEQEENPCEPVEKDVSLVVKRSKLREDVVTMSAGSSGGDADYAGMTTRTVSRKRSRKLAVQ